MIGYEQHLFQDYFDFFLLPVFGFFAGASQANVSKHLQILRRAALVERRKQGLMAYYSILDPSIFPICDLVCGRLSEQYQEDLAAIDGMHNSD